MAEEVKPKFCKDCAYSLIGYTKDYTTARCGAPENKAGFDPVSGEQRLRNPMCHNQRAVNNPPETGMCGIEAVWFKQYPPVDRDAKIPPKKSSLLDLGIVETP